MWLEIIILGLVLATNIWLSNIFSVNSWLALTTILATVLLLLSSLQTVKRSSLLFAIIFAFLVFFQWQTSEKINLLTLDTSQQILHQQRLNLYPKILFNILNKQINLPLANIFELRKESIAISNLQVNFSQTLDLNFYFFASHPREVIGIPIIEKFSFILLPFFLIGLYQLIKSPTKRSLIFFSAIIPITLLTLIGHHNQLGPFSLFPFIGVTTVLGISLFVKQIASQEIFPL